MPEKGKVYNRMTDNTNVDVLTSSKEEFQYVCIAIRHVRDRDQNKNVQLFNIQNSISFHESTVIRNDVMFLHKPCNFSR